MTPELAALLEKAKSHVMTAEERAAQRESFVRGLMPAGCNMTADQIRVRLAAVNKSIAEYPCWGAGLTELSEEREELEQSLLLVTEGERQLALRSPESSS